MHMHRRAASGSAWKLSAMKVPKRSSPLTRRWRKMDSNFRYAGAVNLVVAPLCRRLLRTGWCARSVFGQHDALHLQPEGFRRQACAFDKSSQFGPGQIGVDPTAEAAIRAGDDILAADDCRVAQDSVGNELGVPIYCRCGFQKGHSPRPGFISRPVVGTTMIPAKPR
jgi:hypothetical protein